MANLSVKRTLPARIDTSAYIVNLVTGTVINLFAIPDTLSQSASASFEQISILGRSSPFVSYEGNSLQEVSFTIEISDEYLDEDINSYVNKCLSLVYPEYGSVVIPPSCFLRIGNISFRGYCENVSITWKKPISNDSFRIAEIAFSFTKNPSVIPSSSIVEEGRY